MPNVFFSINNKVATIRGAMNRMTYLNLLTRVVYSNAIFFKDIYHIEIAIFFNLMVFSLKGDGG